MNTIFSSSRCALSAIALLLMGGSGAKASVEYTFNNISSNSVDADTIAGQLKMFVVPAADAWSEWGVVMPHNADVLFVFLNAVGVRSSISEIYFDDGTIMGQTGIHNSVGHVDSFTNFSTYIKPGDLPGGENFGFVATAGFGADAWGNPSNGVDTADDAVGISIELLPGLDFGAVIAALDGPEPALRVGLRLRSEGLDGAQSDSFINNPGVEVVPEAASVIVWSILTLGGVITLGKRQTA